MEYYYPIILDGATGTQLQKSGYTGEICAEKWTLDHPEVIQKIQNAYEAAGSNIVYAPTFSANRVKLEENGIFGQVSDYNHQLVNISREAVGENTLVAADLAPTGKFIPPMGDTSFETLFDIYREQVEALEDAGVDLYVIETTMTVPEARAAVLAVKSISSKPIYVSFTCNSSGKTLTGTDVTAAILIMEGLGVDAFGLNCSVGPEDMLTQLKRLSEFSALPLIAKPNAGVPELIDGKTVYRCTPEEFSQIIPAFAEAGVRIFGGCCGTDERHIAAIREALSGIDFDNLPKHGRNQSLLPCATEKSAFLLPANVSCDVFLDCSESLADDIEDAQGNHDMIGIVITSDSDLIFFAEAQYSITKPLCLKCNDSGLLEKALRLYQGRPLYEGTIPESEISMLQDKYGVIA